MKKLFSGLSPKNILIGLVPTLLFAYVIQPLIGFAVTYSGNILQLLVNYYYQSVATITENEFTKLVLLHLFTAFYGIITVWFLQDIFKYSRQIKSSENHKQIEENSTDDSAASLMDEVTKIQEEMKDIKENISKLATEPNVNIKQIKKNRIALIVFLGIYIINFISIFIFIYSPVIHKKTFDIAIIKITPYVEPKEIDLLRSDWVRMKTKEDYKKLEERIDNIIQENNL